jgi:hypothetical protein
MLRILTLGNESSASRKDIQNQLFTFEQIFRFARATKSIVIPLRSIPGLNPTSRG